MRQLDLASAFEEKPVGLVNMRLLKAVRNDKDVWTFSGIASDEGSDVEGDTILRKSLDLSYAQERGYVNWDHSRDPKNQIGYLTQCEIIDKANIPELEKQLGVKLQKSASVYVEGSLYPYVDQAVEVQKIMKSVDGSIPALGLSLDGAMARAKSDNSVVKAFVRGVAITPAPAHTKTMVTLRKSLEEVTRTDLESKQLANTNPELAKEVADLVRAELRKSANNEPTLSYDDAVMWVLKQRPSWSYDLANKLVRFTVQSTGKG